MDPPHDIWASPRNLGTLVRRLIDKLDSAVEESYRDCGLDYRPRYTPIVRALREIGPCALPRLAGHMGLSQAIVGQTVAEMAARGLITPVRQDQEAGVKLISLSPKMIEMMPKVERCWDATTLASATLDEELGQSLPDLLARAIALLEHRSLSVRIVEARLRLEADDIARRIP